MRSRKRRGLRFKGAMKTPILCWRLTLILMTNLKGQSKKSKRPIPNTKTKEGKFQKANSRSLSNSLNSSQGLKKNHQVPRRRWKRELKQRESKEESQKVKRQKRPDIKFKKLKLKKKILSRS